MRFSHTLTAVLLTFGLAHNALADQIHAAVAANFTSPFKALAASFEQTSGHTVIASFGATGKFYSQITQGAPFDIFFAADRKTPEKLVTEGHAVNDSLYTYAFGKLVLWSPDPAKVDAEGKVLEKGEFAHLAIANPKTAPYGAAAEQALGKMGLADTLKGKIAQGESITQAYQFAVTGNAELAFIAFSQLKDSGSAQGSHWLVPADLYDPIEQAAVVLKKAEGSAAVKAFVEFMRGDEAKKVIESYGYTVE
jgi:molybdate transport system substrate-binding protein